LLLKVVKFAKNLAIYIEDPMELTKKKKLLEYVYLERLSF